MNGKLVRRILAFGGASAALSAASGLHAQVSVAPPAPAADQEAQASSDVGDIIVTAQKRSESINRVPISITAASGDALRARGVVQTADLAKIVPGLSATVTNSGLPVYTLRGVGLFDYGLASSPAVSIYVDQVALATPSMTLFSPFDLERVEVLKGPQGTLFGANSTGGAINFVAAKPTREASAGFNAEYRRFGRVVVDGFVSGSVTKNLTARVAARFEGGGAWQYSLTRPGDRLGSRRNAQIRTILDWSPTSDLRVEAGLTYGYDNSESTAKQFTKQVSLNPAIESPAFLALKPSPNDNRAADWTPGLDYRAKNRSLISYLRADWDLTSDVTLTSLTSYQKFHLNFPQDQSGFNGPSLAGVTGPAFFSTEVGNISDINQELRLAGAVGIIKWTVGGNYDRKRVHDENRLLSNLTISQPLPFVAPFETAAGSTRQRLADYAVFANVDAEIIDRLTVHAGLRYTKSKRDAVNCTFDYGNGQLGAAFTALQGVFASLGVKTTPVVPVTNQCVSLSPAPDLSPQLGGTPLSLSEDNLSWRFGLDYRLAGGTLVYASANRGYKSGIISLFTASSAADFVPATQERLDAFEAGFKAPFGNGKYQLNGAVFYYLYQDKQIRGTFADPIFGPQERLLNIPRSRVQGGEAELQARPVSGLNLAVAATYLDTKITSTFLNFNSQQNFGDLRGSRLPFTAGWQVTSDAQYEWDLNRSLRMFVGGSFSYRSSQISTFETRTVPAPDYHFPSYGLIDLRAGIASAHGNWRLTVFGENVTDKFYVTSLYQTSDYRFRTAGTPAMYGIRLSTKM